MMRDAGVAKWHRPGMRGGGRCRKRLQVDKADLFQYLNDLRTPIGGIFARR
jgi:hypothetical protein